MAALALTVLLALLWIALVGVGYWHGGWRQIVLLAAMLLSYAVLSEWAAPNGRDLSARFHWSVARTTTGVALCYLLAGTLILGLLGSFALYRPRPLGPVERRLGAAMGVLNGGLFLALALRTLRSYAFVAGRGQALHASLLSRFLIEDVGYLLLAALALGAVGAVVGLIATRRDETREMALLDAVATPAVTIPVTARHDDRPAVPAPPAPVTPSASPVPVYATAPLIDWPTRPPPGVQAAPQSVEFPLPEAPNVAAQPDSARVSAPLPARPQAPPRVPPPMIYPVATLLAAQAKLATHVTRAAPSMPPPIPSQPAPLPDAALPSVANTMQPVRPIGPPPGATHPTFVLPTAVQPPMPLTPQQPTRANVAGEPPPVMRERDPPAAETPPPTLREGDVAMGEASLPSVRQLNVATQDVPIVRKDAESMPKVAQDDPQPDTKGETMHADPQTPPTAPPIPNATLSTTAMPMIVPPPLPPMPTARPTASAIPPTPKSVPPAASNQRTFVDEAAKARTGFARVAVARQAGSRADETEPTHPHPAAPPEPLQPPLPTGPRVHHCSTCGYPVRDHARYCPNCGSRQGR